MARDLVFGDSPRSWARVVSDEAADISRKMNVDSKITKRNVLKAGIVAGVLGGLWLLFGKRKDG